MSHFIEPYDMMSLEDFEELLPDMPYDQRWELIDGRVIKMMVGARWEHNMISQNIAYGLRQQLKARKAPCRVFLETFYMKSKVIESATLPDVMVACGHLSVGATSVDDPVILVESCHVAARRGTATRNGAPIVVWPRYSTTSVSSGISLLFMYLIAPGRPGPTFEASRDWTRCSTSPLSLCLSP